jgi:hypothetical protein
VTVLRRQPAPAASEAPAHAMPSAA